MKRTYLFYALFVILCLSLPLPGEKRRAGKV